MKDYNFVHRPFEDKGTKQAKERDSDRKRMFGVKGSPQRSEHRHLSKVFDHRRNKARDNNGTIGCDEDYHLRNMTMKVGSCIRGGLKTLNTETARREQNDLNKNPNSKKEKIISKRIENRGKTESAFAGDNHFFNLARDGKWQKEKSPRTFSVMMSCDDQSISMQGQ